jgi:hypothetical protein
MARTKALSLPVHCDPRPHSGHTNRIVVAVNDCNLAEMERNKLNAVRSEKHARRAEEHCADC